MPKTSSAKKQMRQNEKRRLVNKKQKSALKTQIKKFGACIEKADLEGAKRELPLTVSKLDRVVHKSILHKNTVARQKSKLYRDYNNLAKNLASVAQAQTAPAASPEQPGEGT